MTAVHKETDWFDSLVQRRLSWAHVVLDLTFDPNTEIESVDFANARLLHESFLSGWQINIRITKNLDSESGRKYWLLLTVTSPKGWCLGAVMEAYSKNYWLNVLSNHFPFLTETIRKVKRTEANRLFFHHQTVTGFEALQTVFKTSDTTVQDVMGNCLVKPEEVAIFECFSDIVTFVSCGVTMNQHLSVFIESWWDWWGLKEWLLDGFSFDEITRFDDMRIFDPKIAKGLNQVGLTFDEAVSWLNMFSDFSNPYLVIDLVKKGWTRDGVYALVSSFNDSEFINFDDFLYNLNQWNRLLPGSQSSALLSSGISYQEIRNKLEKGSAPNLCQMSLMASLKPVFLPQYPKYYVLLGKEKGKFEQEKILVKDLYTGPPEYRIT